MLLTTFGSIDGTSRGEEMLTEAVDVLAAADLPIELSLAHGGLAWASHRRGGQRDAERHARRALTLARSTGTTAVARDATRVLASMGGTDPGPGEALTQAERRVAVLAAEGATNAEVASHLHVGRKAVEFHLSNVYRKLGIAGRRELADALEGPPEIGGAQGPKRPAGG